MVQRAQSDRQHSQLSVNRSPVFPGRSSAQNLKFLGPRSINSPCRSLGIIVTGNPNNSLQGLIIIVSFSFERAKSPLCTLSAVIFRAHGRPGEGSLTAVSQLRELLYSPWLWRDLCPGPPLMTSAAPRVSQSCCWPPSSTRLAQAPHHCRTPRASKEGPSEQPPPPRHFLPKHS